MKIKMTFILCLLLFVGVLVSAQTHDNSRGACQLFKSSVQEEGASCPACVAIIKKEDDAREAESKRRQDAIKIEIEAQKKGRKAAMEKEDAKIAKKNKVTEVFATIPKGKNAEVKNTAPATKTEPVKIEKNYFLTENNDINSGNITDMYTPHQNKYVKADNYFIINNEKRFANNEFKACIGSRVKYREENEFNFPPNIGIVVLHETFKNENGKEFPISDLIDLKGNRILKDNSISTIIHFADDYFIAFSGEPWKRSGYNEVRFSRTENAFIYNLKTKQKYPIPHFTSDNVDLGYEFDYLVNLGRSNDIDKSKYKARFRSKLTYETYIYYFITLDGKLEEQRIN